MSYAEIASKGAKQSPAEAAAPQPPRVDANTSTAASSTGSLIDVDTPSVHTVPSDFGSQEIQTDTQASRVEREEEDEEEEEEDEEESQEESQAEESQEEREKKEKEREKEAARVRAQGEADRRKKRKAAADEEAAAARKDRRAAAQGWLAKQLGGLTAAGGAVSVVNFVAVVGLSGWLGFRAWGLYDRGRLGWKEAGVGLGVLGAVGVVEGVFLNYFSKGSKGKEH